MRKLTYISALLVLISFSGNLRAEDEDYSSLSLEEILSLNLTKTGLLDVPHVHPKGDWMVTYKFHRMDMHGISSGNLSLSTSEVLNSYAVSPIEMTMNMHMLGAMYGVSDKLNFMGMLNYTSASMDLITRTSTAFSTAASKIGDVKATVLYKFTSTYNSQFFTTVGLSLPTGDINVRRDTPMGNAQKLPYPMQFSSGTVDPELSLTYIKTRNKATYGANAKTVVRLYDNSNGYHLGNQYALTSWYSYSLSDVITVYGRSDGNIWGNVRGADPDLNPMMSPTADPDLRGGKSLQMGFGANVAIGAGSLRGTTLSFQYKKPVYQDLNGPQLGMKGQFSFGVFVNR